MGSKWDKVSIDALKSTNRYSCVGGPFGSSLSRKHYEESGVPVIRGVNLSGDEFKDSDFVYVSVEKGESLSRNLAYPGDLVFTQRGTLGQVALIPEDALFPQYVVSQSQMKLSVNPDVADAYFLYLYFRTKATKKRIEKSAIVGGVPHINLGILKGFEVELPPLPIQKKISALCMGFDKKITLNNQINQTLEQMAQTLFKSWFVDFDPVIDNALDVGNAIPEELEVRAEGRKKERESKGFQSLPNDVRLFFPNEFEESNLGWVPKGWRTTRLENILELAYGRALKKIDRIEGVYPVYGSGGINGTHNEFFIQGPGIIVGRKGTVGSLYWEDNNFCPIDTVFYVKPKRGYSLSYCYYLLQTLGLDGMNTDAAVPGLNRNNAYRLECVLPSDEVLNQLAKVLERFRNKMNSCVNEGRTLLAMRDTLLPKLISGEIKLKGDS